MSIVNTLYRKVIGIKKQKIKETESKEFENLLEKIKIAGDRKGEIRIYGRRFNLMGAEYWTAGLYKVLEETVGKGSEGILYRSGFEVGKEHHKFIEEEFEDKNKAEKFGKYLGLLKFCGYGHIGVDHRDESLVIISKDSPDAEEWKRLYKKKMKVCHYLRGLFSGFLTSLFGKKINLIETKCQAEGADNCEFKIEETTSEKVI